MAWRLAKSLTAILSQVDKQWPNRNKATDGTIGDLKHQSTSSDHNAWIKDGKTGVVSAIDITHSPSNGPDTYAMAEKLRQTKDTRIKYCISNGRIFSATVSPWTWRKYTGSHPHHTHIHISVKSTKAHYDDNRPWDFSYAPGAPSPPTVDDSPKNRPILRKGSQGEEVRTVQRLLVVSIDGNFGDITENAVKRFQKFEKLTQDGVVGPLTWAKLDEIEQMPTPMDYDEPHQLSEPL